MAYKNLQLTTDGLIAKLTFNRPQVLNALNIETMTELGAAIAEIDQNKELRGLIVTGAGEKSFIAGADINEFTALTPSAARDLAHLGQRVTRNIEQLRIPVIAAVNGFCLGGGCEVALACDFILASDNAKFGLPEVSLGLIPGWGGTQRLARFIGAHKARMWVYSAQKFSAQEACNQGLVLKVFPAGDLMRETESLMQKISENSPFALAQAKRSINEGTQVDLDRGLILEQASFGLCFSAEDLREGVAAFKEKRKPQFKGR